MWVLHLLRFASSPDYEEEEVVEHEEFVKITFTNIAHVLHRSASNFYGDHHLEVSRC